MSRNPTGGRPPPRSGINPLKVQRDIINLDKKRETLLEKISLVFSYIRDWRRPTEGRQPSQELHIDSLNDAALDLNTSTVNSEGAQATATLAINGMLQLHSRILDIREENAELRKRIASLESLVKDVKNPV